MQFPPFLKAYKALEHKKKAEYACPGDARLSFPVVVKRGGQLYDGLFSYLNGASPDTAPRPCGWLLLSMEDGAVKLAADCAAVDFMNTQQYPLGAQVSMKLPESTDLSKVKRLAAELFDAYDDLREFVFSENLSRDQVAAIVRYKDLFMRLCPKGQYAYYHGLSPAFFGWLRLPLPEGPGGAAQETGDDMRDYQYQLIILENLQQLVKQFQEKIAVDGHKEQLFDEMHRQAQEYKNGMLESLTKHIELDVIQLMDQLGKSLSAFEGREHSAGQSQKLLALLEGTRTDLADILYRQGVDPYTVPGDEVDVSRQNTVSTVKTARPELDRRICARLASGWSKNGRVIRPERVSVYVYEK
ncbi:MAG: nucleotide exchange factor GrpE [Oscillospiraceae bacterium]|nr:nucleotide exchange factor GrpE [Oscillospiraceae bacterium]